MKKYYLLVFIFIFRICAYSQCSWKPVVFDDFTKLSYSKINSGDIALGPDGNPYVVYNDEAYDFKATVMKYNGNSWAPVGDRGFTKVIGYTMKLFIDPSGIPYLFYFDSSIHSGWVMKFDGNKWIQLGKEVSTGLYTTICEIKTDNTGVPYTSFFDENNKGSVMKFNGTDWVNIDSVYLPDKVKSLSMAFDSANKLYVAYARYQGAYKVIKFNGMDWEQVGKDIYKGSSNSYIKLLIGSNNIPYALLGDDTTYSTMKFDSADWVYDIQPNLLIKEVSPIEFSTDQSNALYISYQSTNKKYFLKKMDGTKWLTITETDSLEAFDQISKVVSQEGKCYILCQDHFHGNNASVLTNEALNWNLLGNYGIANSSVYSSSMATDNKGIPYVVFSDENDSSKCTVKRLEGNNWVVVGKKGFSKPDAENCKIALDKNGFPYVAYLAASKGYLLIVMKYDGSNWINVGSSNIAKAAVQSLSIAFDKNNVPYVAYSEDGQTISVKKFDGANWNIVGQAITGSYANVIHIAFGKNNAPYLGYSNNAYVGILELNGTTWVKKYTAASITNPPYSVYNAAFAIDSSDAFWVAFSMNDYTTNLNGILRIVRFSPTMPDFNTIYTTGVNVKLSIVLDEHHNACIAYAEERDRYKISAKLFNGHTWMLMGSGACSPYKTDCSSLACDQKGNFYLAYCGKEEATFPNKTDDVFVKKFSLYSQPLSDTVCPGQTTTFQINTWGNNLNCQWQEYKDSTWSDIQNSVIYNGATTSTLTILTVNDSMDTYKYRCILNSPCAIMDTSDVVVLTVKCNVWPGDTDNNRKVNNNDLLPIGLHYSQAGPPRITVTNKWEAFTASDWMTTQTNGFDLKHVDCNGDGIINVNDTLAVGLNFGLFHGSVPVNTPPIQGIPELYLKTDSVYHPEDIINAELWLGTSQLKVSDLYGIAFDLNYDANYIQPGSESLTYTNSWFALPGTNAIKFSKVAASTNTIYGAETRIDKTDITGYGNIANLKFRLKKDIPDHTKLFFSFSGYQANDNKGKPIFLKTITDSITVISTVNGLPKLSQDIQMVVYPNPFSMQTTILLNQEFKDAQIEIINILGQEVKSINFSGTQISFNKENMEPGIYFLQLFSKNKLIARDKLMVQ